MKLSRLHTALLLVNLGLLLGFGAVFLQRRNYEFIIYEGVIVAVLFLIGFSIRRVDYTPAALVGLTIWSALHLAGGGVTVGAGRLYDVMLLQLSASLPVFRYDQLVHVWGFGASTLIMFCLLRRHLSQPARYPLALGVVVVMAGLGAGALNEVLEFIVSICVPGSGVGGYVNTALDLCADLLGALLGWGYIRVHYLKHQETAP
ncbi:MAG: DUF2238 domain-containing protein [Kiritimatiellaeota bacterium]|nr:DUF2238 domain-containing protein [Kiritimatiellota bacterium]